MSFEFEFQFAFLKESSFIKGIKVSFIVKIFIGNKGYFTKPLSNHVTLQANVAAFTRPYLTVPIFVHVEAILDKINKNIY